MADNDQNNDEYEFSDLDALNPGTLEESEAEDAPSGENQGHAYIEGTNIKRNALIVIGIFIVVVVIYRILSAYFSEPSKVPTKPKQQKQQVTRQTKPTPQRPAVIQQQQSTVSPSEKDDVQKAGQKISALELTQKNMRSEVENVSHQLSGIHSNLNALTSNINDLKSMLSDLENKIENQSRDINRLIANHKAKHRKPIARKSSGRTRTKYYIQAVIPGRAWLISSSGSTLTVSEGSNIPGYGAVKLIDPHQGRVIMAGGKIIKFHQNDN